MDDRLQERIERSVQRPTSSFAGRRSGLGRGLSGGRMVVMLLLGALAGVAWMTFVGGDSPEPTPTPRIERPER